MAIRIGLTPRDFIGWHGGRELFGLIASSLLAGLEPGDRLELATRVGDGGAAWRMLRKARHGGRRVLGRGGLAAEPAADPGAYGLPVADPGTAGFDVAGPFAAPPRGLDRPWVGYVPDLQHRRLPEMFSPRERAARDRNILRLLKRAPVILVNAADVANDLAHFYPPPSGRIIALPFAPCLDAGWLDEAPLAPDEVEPPFFLCSNQFWKHKNHVVVIEAVRLAREAGAPIRILFTGDTSDYRHPDHFPDLQRRIAGAGIGGDVEILGFVPKTEQIRLMRRAIAVVQPSLFEGAPGGGAAYNAVALGRPVVVADIPVNHEIENADVQFFDPFDPADLLAKLRSMQSRLRPARNDETLLSLSDARRRALGRALRAAFAAAIDRKDG